MALEDVRTEIQDIDMQILGLMKRRLELAVLVGEDKVARNAAVRNIPQENKVIDRYRGFALENGMNPVYAEKICRTLMQESIEIQAALPRTTSRMRHIAIVGGYGKMGRWFADLLKGAGHRVDIIDPSSGNGLVIEDAKWADAVIVSVPISRTGPILQKLDEICKPETLIFDLASLKSPFIDVLQDMGSRRRVCSIHPMFGPSAESMYERNVIVCDCGSEAAVDEAMESGIDFPDMQSVASTTFSKLMDTNESVALEDPYLYYEIQHMNANREQMLTEFDTAVHDVVEAALSDDPRAFKDLMDRGREYFT